MADVDIESFSGSDATVSTALDGLSARTRDLTTTANGFARAMTQAFSTSVTGARQLDDVLIALSAENLRRGDSGRSRCSLVTLHVFTESPNGSS